MSEPPTDGVVTRSRSRQRPVQEDNSSTHNKSLKTPGKCAAGTKTATQKPIEIDTSKAGGEPRRASRPAVPNQLQATPRVHGPAPAAADRAARRQPVNRKRKRTASMGVPSQSPRQPPPLEQHQGPPVTKNRDAHPQGMTGATSTAVVTQAPPQEASSLQPTRPSLPPPAPLPVCQPKQASGTFDPDAEQPPSSLTTIPAGAVPAPTLPASTLVATSASPTTESSDATALCASNGSAHVNLCTTSASIISPTAGVSGSGFPRASGGMELYRRLVTEASEGAPGEGELWRAGEGTRVWVKMAGYCHWPAVVFSLRHCRKSEVPDLLASYQPGRTLVHFYGSHDYAWAGTASLSAWTTDREARLAALRATARGAKVAASTLAELTSSLGANAAVDPARELARIVALREAAMARGGGGGSASCGRARRKAQCSGCGEEEAQVTCAFCRKSFHSLCLPQPDVSPAHMLAAALEGQQEAARETIAAPHQHHPQRKPQQVLLKAMWSCGACGKHNELQGSVPVSTESQILAAAGANVARGDAPAGGREVGAGAMLSSSVGASGASGSPMSPPGDQLHYHQQHQHQHQQQWTPSHADLLALYERLLDEDAKLEAAAATVVADAAVVTEAATPGPQVSVAAAEAAGPMTTRDAASSGPPGRGEAQGSATAVAVAVRVAATTTRPAPRPLPGTRLWVKTPGYCHWPAVVFSLRHCRKSEVPDLLASYQPGRTLVHFYGEHNHTWLPDEEVSALVAAAVNPREEEERRAALVAWSSRRKKSARSVHIALAELDRGPAAGTATDGDGATAGDAPSRSLSCQLSQPQSQSPSPPQPQEAAVHSGSPLIVSQTNPDQATTSSLISSCPTKVIPSEEVLRVVALREARLLEEMEQREAEVWELMLTEAREGGCAAGNRRGDGRGGAEAGGAGGSCSGSGSGSQDRDAPTVSLPSPPFQRSLSATTAPRAAGATGATVGGLGRSCWDPREAAMGGWRACLRVCTSCGEPGGQVCCMHCRRAFHALCLTPRWLSPAFMPPQQPWTCTSCGRENMVTHPGGSRSGDGGPSGGGGTLEEERMGLTPDWIIMAGAFKVFQLPRPTASIPYIRGLLDPCTNSKANPNIPAEKLYDKHDDGLRLSSSWAGYYVILNPEYTSQTQWRFVNRAIDEVENGSVPAVLLLCRNSTDTAYFQRLRPYPRVMLKRTSARFKDYEKTPIGFGIAVFCIAPRGPGRAPLFRRFIDAFGDWGEPNIPIDAAFVDSPAFSQLLDRLADHTTRHMRDTWVQCSACHKWRIVPYEVYQRLDELGPRREEQLEPQEHQERGLAGGDCGDGSQTSAPRSPTQRGKGQDEGGEAKAEAEAGEHRRPARNWTCFQLGPGSSCDRPQSRIEAAGVNYARQRASRRPVQRGLTGASAAAVHQTPGGPTAGPQQETAVETEGMVVGLLAVTAEAAAEPGRPQAACGERELQARMASSDTAQAAEAATLMGALAPRIEAVASIATEDEPVAEMATAATVAVMAVPAMVVEDMAVEAAASDVIMANACVAGMIGEEV